MESLALHNHFISSQEFVQSITKKLKM